jgi:hypothetical protein
MKSNANMNANARTRTRCEGTSAMKTFNRVRSQLYEMERKVKSAARAQVIPFRANAPIKVVGRDGIERQYSRGDIVRGTGLSMSYVSRIFSGGRTPSVPTLRLLAWYFDCNEAVLSDLLHVEIPWVRGEKPILPSDR